MGTNYVKAFEMHGASLKNPQWSFSAKAGDGALVMSCWTDFFVPSSQHRIPGVMRYRDTLERISHNDLGRNELESFLKEAQDNAIPIRLIVARAGDSAVLTQGKSASSAKNQFNPRRDVIGSLVSFDGNEFVIDFRAI